jgi:hypothetical protein
MKTFKKFLKNYNDNTLMKSVINKIVFNLGAVFLTVIFISFVSVVSIPEKILEQMNWTIYWNAVLPISIILGVFINNFNDYLFYARRRKNNLLFARRIRAERKDIKIHLPMDVELKFNYDNSISGKLEEYYIVIDKKSAKYYTENSKLVCCARAYVYSKDKEEIIHSIRAFDNDKTLEGLILRNYKMISETIENLSLEEKEKESFIFVDKD